MKTADMRNPVLPPGGPAPHRLACAAALLLLISCALTRDTPPQAPPPPEQDIHSSPPQPGTPPLEPPPVSPAPASRSPETPVPAPPAPETPALASRALDTSAPAPELPSPETPAPADSSPARPPVKVNLFKRPPDSSAPFKKKTRKSEPASPKEPKRTHPRKIREPSLDFSRLREPAVDAPPVQVPINPLKEPDIPLYPSVPSADLQTPAEPPDSSAGNPAPEPPPPGNTPSTSPPNTSLPGASPVGTPPLSASPPPVPPDPAPRVSPARPAHPALSAEAPERHLDAPGTFTVTLKGQGWVFRSDLAEPGAWTYLEREREGDSTRFHFRVDRQGAWNLVFDRQDLSGGGVERTVRRIRAGGSNAPLTPPHENPSPELDTPREAVAAGRFEDAFALWEDNAGRSGPEGRAARENIVRQASLLGVMAPLVKWLNPYIQDGPDPLILETVLERLTNTVGYQKQSISVLEALLARERRDEWLYRLAFLLEQPGERRDIDRAAQLYRELVASRTLSIWRDRAEKRISRLERHYYRVR